MRKGREETKSGAKSVWDLKTKREKEEEEEERKRRKKETVTFPSHLSAIVYDFHA